MKQAIVQVHVLALEIITDRLERGEDVSALAQLFSVWP